MKLGKTVWKILCIIIFVIIIGSLYMVNNREKQEQRQLDDNFLVVQASLEKSVSDKTDHERQLTQLKTQLSDLESELAQATSLLNDTKESFPRSAESIEYDEVLFSIAHDSGVQIVKIKVSEPIDEIIKIAVSELTDQEVENVTYSTIRFEVELEGEVTALLDFINSIATGEHFKAATVEQVNIRIPEPVMEEEQEAEEGEAEEEGEVEEEGEAGEEKETEAPSATIEFVVYSYEGG